MKYENIQTSVHDAVAVVTLDRPKVLNALNHAMMAEPPLALPLIATKPSSRHHRDFLPQMMPSCIRRRVALMMR